MASCLRQFLAPRVWNRARAGHPKPRRDARRDLHHLILVPLAMTWSLGESTPERFEMARGLLAIGRPKRRRAGRAGRGSHQAPGRPPRRPLVALAGAPRGRLVARPGDDLVHGGSIPLGGDGSPLECRGNDEWRARPGPAGQADCSPSLRVTAVVHPRAGVPRSWGLGRGNAGDRDHPRRLLPSVPRRAPVVADAGLDGYDPAVSILNPGASFLIRMSSESRLSVTRPTDRGRSRQGQVSYRPGRAQQAGLPPPRPGLIRVLGRGRGRGPKRAVAVGLLTGVGAEPMTIARAAWAYRRGWEDQGPPRSHERTLSKVHRVGRTVRSVHRQGYGSLLACPRRLARGAWALREAGDRAPAVVPCGVRQAILAVREGLNAARKGDRRES